MNDSLKNDVASFQFIVACAIREACLDASKVEETDALIAAARSIGPMNRLADNLGWRSPSEIVESWDSFDIESLPDLVWARLMELHSIESGKPFTEFLTQSGIDRLDEFQGDS